jgi:lipoyl synthase
MRSTEIPTTNHHKKKPDWLRIKLPSAKDYSHIKEYLTQANLFTICESGKCPNQAECWAAKTATFLILGNICTRNCKFCGVTTGKPLPEDILEPEKLAEVVHHLKLKHCVITSVTRDDLKDGGAKIWHDTITCVRKKNPDVTIEALIPDFDGKPELLSHVIQSRPDIISHNLETVRRLTTLIRGKASFDKSLKVLNTIADSGITSKSGLMVGLGETNDEISATMDELIKVNCKILTIGQYLQPGRDNYPVIKYYTPEEFERIKEIAIQKEFRKVECGPLVRSSYHAEKHINLPLT